MRLPVQEDSVVEASWKPGLIYVVRIRESGTEAWSFGFKTPLAHFSFVDLKPDTKHELRLCSRNAAQEGEPRLIRIKTGPTGDTDNVIPFPKR